MAIKSGEARDKWGAALQSDLKEILEHIQNAGESMRELEEYSRGVNGLSTFLRNKGNDLEEMARGLEGEIEEVPNKIAGHKGKGPPMKERLADVETIDEIRTKRGARSPEEDVPEEASG